MSRVNPRVRTLAVATVGLGLCLLVRCSAGVENLEPQGAAPAASQVEVGPAPIDSGEADAGEDAGGQPDAATDAGTDAGEDAGPETDAGEGGDAGDDAGEDAGTDAGQDAGVDAGPPLALPTLAGWQFYGPDQGGPRRVYGVSADEAGNVWVAGGDEGLFLLAPGAVAFRRFTVTDGLTPYRGDGGAEQQRAISVAGGPAGTAFVGYQGHYGGLEDNDPPAILKSGDVDKVVLREAGIAVTHIDISTPPGVSSAYPGGRDKIRDVFRIVHDRSTGDVWFGGNHGLAMWNGREHRVREHQHPWLSGYLASGAHTFLTGDYYGVGLDPSGDVWFGGGHRLAKLPFGRGRSFYAALDPRIDVWPDAVPSDARPWQRTDDFVQDLAVLPDGSLWVGSIPNGLAHVSSGGIGYRTSGMVDRKVTALEYDKKNGSLWVGHIWGGITRLSGSGATYYSISALGADLGNDTVPDIQSDNYRGRRRILVAFSAGAIGIYNGD